ncbi:alternative NAD(P)H-ubiquinone oxidoreductase C1, chloroplastic/mitochondrial-like [Daucus carota subsp. sativus]|uniref:alternative NAD(P)H-ubiquinone oxidoreductase C1, chloroplastic/mitochondrial-like n=1 Tax=Daucus carota subsp. sativus TaxID=79200 RepID=UPI0030830701
MKDGSWMSLGKIQFAGSKSIERLTPEQVLLIDKFERFIFKPMLHELLSGEVDSWEIAPRFSDLLAKTGVQFLQDRVKLLHPYDNLRLSGPTRMGDLLCLRCSDSL